MLRVGLTGGYASGKSFVAAELERLGCCVIRADLLGHAALEPGGAAYADTVAAFGPEILDATGAIDRKRLGAIVFADEGLLEKLNSFVHPAVIRREEEMLAEFAGRNPRGIGVVEAAILIETGRADDFDRLIVTVCDEATQIQRGMKRDGLTREQIQARLARQLPPEQKAARADYVIDTSGQKEQTARRVEEVHRELKREAEG